MGLPGLVPPGGGAIEVGSAVLLLIPRLAFLGAAGIAVIMAGATYTHVIRVPEEASRAPLTLGLLAIAVVVGYARRPRRERVVQADARR